MEELISHSSVLRNDEHGPGKMESTNVPQPSPEPLPSEAAASPTPRGFPIVIPTLPWERAAI
jgi:hypothetical protein